MEAILKDLASKLKTSDEPLCKVLLKVFDENNPAIIIKDIQDFSNTGNYVLMRSIFGKPLLTDILNFKK